MIIYNLGNTLGRISYITIFFWKISIKKKKLRIILYKVSAFHKMQELLQIGDIKYITKLNTTA